MGGAGNAIQNILPWHALQANKSACLRTYPGCWRWLEWTRSRSQLPFSSEGPCYWEGVRVFSDYSKSNPLPKPDLTAFHLDIRSGMQPVLMSLERVGKRSKRTGASLIIGPAGNSFSGPHAAGVAALMLSVNPELNPWEVSKILSESATNLGAKGHDYKFGAGLINALAAVRAAKH